MTVCALPRCFLYLWSQSYLLLLRKMKGGQLGPKKNKMLSCLQERLLMRQRAKPHLLLDLPDVSRDFLRPCRVAFNQFEKA